MLLFLLIESWDIVIFSNKILITTASILMDMFNSMSRIKIDKNLFEKLHAIYDVVDWRNKIKRRYLHFVLFFVLYYLSELFLNSHILNWMNLLFITAYKSLEVNQFPIIIVRNGYFKI